MAHAAGPIAVVAHNGKTLGDGLGALRESLARRGHADPLWYEVPKSRKVARRVETALADGARLVLVWGGDGSVQRAVDAMVGCDATLGILPAGTANLLATNLGIPHDLEQALDIALHGADRVLDVGRMNGEHFAVMAGVGMDALMIRDADGTLKGRLGRAAYVWTGARAVRRDAVPMTVRVDKHLWFEGEASCVLVGNVGKILGGVQAFEHARTDDGRLDVAVITARNTVQWVRALARAAFGNAERSPLATVTQARRITVELDTALPYELDGGARKKTKRLKIRAVPKGITVRVPPT